MTCSLTWGPTRDVVMIGTELEQAYGPDNPARRYAMQADWDPRESGGRMRSWCCARRPIQALREGNELPGVP
jgi:hypothetical protein